MWRRAWLLLLAGWSLLPCLAGEQPSTEMPSLSEACGTPIGAVMPGKNPSLKEIGGTQTISGTITLPQANRAIPPDYPRSARLARVGGTVVLSILVCRDGSVEGLRVLKAPSKELAEAAIKAVQQWVYKPATRDGEPVAVHLGVTVDFTLTP